MSNGEVFFRRFDGLTNEERARLWELTTPPSVHPRSVFRQWLEHPTVTRLYAGIVRVDGRTVAWAAASTMEGWKIIQVGVFTEIEMRGRGYAEVALDALIAGLTPQWLGEREYIAYQRGCDRLFAPIVARYGWKDLWRDAVSADYQRRCREREEELERKRSSDRNRSR